MNSFKSFFMSSSTPLPSQLDVSEITFSDNTRLVSATDFYQNIHARKKLRVDKNVEFREDLEIYGNVTIRGAVTNGATGETPKGYVDNQTGWGQEEWTFAGATYNVATDSLIVKIYNIETNYATIAFVNSQFQNTNGKYLVPYAPSTFATIANPTTTYPYAITTLASNTGLIIRDGTNSFNEFKFQRGTITVGHVLTCLDAEGTIGWAPENTISTSAQTISTNYGATNTQYSLKVVDSVSGRGFFSFPNLLSNLYNKAVAANSTSFLMGTGDLINYQAPFSIGCYTNGTELIEFKNSTSSTAPNGSVRISGGSTTLDQQINLNAEGIFFQPRLNQGISFKMPKVTKNLTTNEWTKPVSVYGKLQQNDEYPTFVVTKEDADAKKQSIFFNPRSGSGSFSPLSQAGSETIIFGDSTQFNQDGSEGNYPTTKYNLVIAPWSYKSEGIQMSNSLASEDNAGVSYSGYTRMTGAAAGYYVDAGTRVPTHYVETNIKGIFLKNHTNTQTRNYGPLRVLNKYNTTIMNNTNTTESIRGYLEVGDSTAGCPSTFWGDVTLKSPSRLYYTLAPTLNHVLTCVDATLGTAEWRIPSSSFGQISVSSVKFTTDNSVQSTAMTEAKVQAMIDASIAAKSGVPCGSIIAWGTPSTTIPSGYLECNGQIVTIATYPELYELLKTSWLNYSSFIETQFALPDLRGAYLKGYGNFLYGGTNNQNAGTYQTYHPGQHTHFYKDQGTSNIKVGPKTGSVYSTVADDKTLYGFTEPGIYNNSNQLMAGDETRPNSGVVKWLIKY